MLPTPDTSHVPYERVYEPAEDSFLLLDTLSAPSERAFLRGRFGAAAPLVVEVGTGSGVVLAFVHAQCQALFGRPEVLTAGIDMNPHACRATVATVNKAAADAAAAVRMMIRPSSESESSSGYRSATYLGSSMGDLASCLRPAAVDVLVFNPPYVPTEEMPAPRRGRPPPGFSPEVVAAAGAGTEEEGPPSFEHDSYLLALSYAGGVGGMETTDRLLSDLGRLLSARGCAYVLLCAQNKPDLVKKRLPEQLGAGWKAETVGSSGKTAGWEKLQVVRIWNDAVKVGDSDLAA